MTILTNFFYPFCAKLTNSTSLDFVAVILVGRARRKQTFPYTLYNIYAQKRKMTEKGRKVIISDKNITAPGQGLVRFAYTNFPSVHKNSLFSRD